MANKKNIFGIALVVFGLILMPTGFVLADVIQGEIDKGIADQVSVPSKHSSAFDEWISNDYKDAPEMYETFYLWNLTNSDEFIADGDIPEFDEIGPFIFRRLDYKYDIDFSDDNDEVSYKEYSKYIQTYGDDISEVNITNVNPAFLGAIETAGGTTLDFSKFVLPMVLTDVRETFVEEYLANLPGNINGDAVTQLVIDLGYLPPGIGEINQSLLIDPYSNATLYDYSGALPAETVFFEKWANDYFPNTNHTFNETSIPLGIIHLDNMSLLSLGSAQFQGNAKVNTVGSATGEGVDIDGRAPYNFTGSYADLNISTNKIVQYPHPHPWIDYQVNEGGSGLNYTQCLKLWNKSIPDSLTGYDYEINKIWWDALDGDIESRQYLNDTFALNDIQLDLILDWINVSVHTWAKNVAGYTQGVEWNSGFIVTRTIEEWLFTANDTAVYEHQHYYGYEEDLELIGFFDNCHNTAEAEAAEVPKFKVKTGRDDVSEVGQVIEFNGQEEIYIWAEPIEVEGTLGTQFAPGVTEDDTLKVFNVDLLRVVELEYDEPAEIYDIELLQFETAEDTFSPNSLYFQTTEGIANLATVEKYHKAPVRVSKPHFLGAPYSVLYGVSGMSPNSDIHETYVRVEPLTGIVMQAAVKAQVNFQVRPDDLYFQNISNTIMPVVWFEEYGEIPEDLAEEFKDVLYSAIELKETVPIMFLGIGAALCVPGAVLIITQIVKRRRS
ncbi:MAG: hypothetical protein ACFFD2_24170 [Promethearchaeota archaeon]